MKKNKKKYVTIILSIFFIILIIVTNFYIFEYKYPFILSDKDIASPDFCVDKDQNIYMVWGFDSNRDCVEDKIFLKKIDKNNNVKINRIIVDHPEASYFHQLLIDSNQDLHLIWWKVKDKFEDRSESCHWPQNGYLFYKKFDRNGNDIISDKKIFNEVMATHVLDEIKIDNQNQIHLFCGKGYCILDNNGNLLHCANEDADTFIIDSNQTSYLFFESLNSIYAKQIRFINNSFETIKNDTLIVKNAEPISVIFDREEKLHFTYKVYDESEFECGYGYKSLKLNKNYTVINNISTRPSYPVHNIYDNDKNLVIINVEQDSCEGKDVKLFYSKISPEGEVLIDYKLFLTIEKERFSDHGPSLCEISAQCDENNNLHLSGFIERGSNSYDILYVKLNEDGKVINKILSVESYYPNSTSFIILIIILDVVIFIVIMKLLLMKIKKIDNKTEPKNTKTLD